MNKEETKKVIIDVLSSYFHKEVTEKTDLIADLNANSIDEMEFTMILEDKLNIDLYDSPIPRITKVEQILDLCWSKLEIKNNNEN